MLHVGFITTVSGRWPRELPNDRLRKYGAWLREQDFPHTRVDCFEELVDSPAALEKALAFLREKAVDLVVMVYGAFTGDDVCTVIGEQLRVPVLLWAPYEPPFSRDDRLYANALVAQTMNAASMRRLLLPCHTAYGDYTDPRVAGKVRDLISAYAVKKRLSGMLLGLLGYRPTAFYNSAFDEGLIRRTFGIRMEETDLKTIFDRMESFSKEAVQAEINRVESSFGDISLPEGHLENHARLYLALKEIIGQTGYAYSVIKCWPEMGQLKTTPCAVMGRLADEGMQIGCEGDVDAMLGLIVENLLTGLPGFISDMINVDETENTMTFWHCGNPAPSLFNPAEKPQLRNHPLAGQGTAFWTSLKPGPVTVARFCNIDGAYKLFLLKGEAVETKRSTRGAMVNVRVAKPVREMLDFIFESGVPHHYALVWQDVADQMRTLCGLWNIPVLEA